MKQECCIGSKNRLWCCVHLLGFWPANFSIFLLEHDSHFVLSQVIIAVITERMTHANWFADWSCTIRTRFCVAMSPVVTIILMMMRSVCHAGKRLRYILRVFVQQGQPTPTHTCYFFGQPSEYSGPELCFPLSRIDLEAIAANSPYRKFESVWYFPETLRFIRFGASVCIEGLFYYPPHHFPVCVTFFAFSHRPVAEAFCGRPAR